MFRELMPILEERTLMLTLSRVDDVTIRVCVIPKRVKEHTGENALCTPLTVTGTIDELDQNFAAQLNSYTSAVVKLGSNLAEIEATHRAARKAVEEEKKKDLDRKRGKVNGSKATAEPEPKPGPVIKDGKPVFGTKDGSGATSAPTLFDAASESTSSAERTDVQAAAAGASPDA
jgi:PRTRC genetic system protein E